MADDGADQSPTTTVTITVSAMPPIVNRTFYVVDFSSRRTFEYAGQGAALGDNALTAANLKPLGIAANAEGTRMWVVDKTKKVYAYDDAGALLGSWVPSGPSKVDGIATDGESIWIVDRGSDRVWMYDGAAGWTSGTRNAESVFNLNRKNGASAGITTDGTHLWVVNNNAAKDEVFKYTMTGQLVGKWQIDPVNSTPTGITIDPNNIGHIWIVDAGTDRVYQYDDGIALTSGTVTASASFALAANNTNPQGIADPPRNGHDTALSAVRTNARRTRSAAAFAVDRRDSVKLPGTPTEKRQVTLHDQALEELTRRGQQSTRASIADQLSFPNVAGSLAPSAGKEVSQTRLQESTLSAALRDLFGDSMDGEDSPEVFSKRAKS